MFELSSAAWNFLAFGNEKDGRQKIEFLKRR